MLERLSNTTARLAKASPLEPCVADVSQQWEDAQSGCSRALVRLRLRRGTLRSALRHLRTSGVADPFVLARLSNTAARLAEASPRTQDLRRVWPM